MKTDIFFGIVTQMMVALCLLTRLPVPKLSDAALAHSARAVWAYPLAGLVVGGLATGAGVFALWLGLSAELSAGICLSVLAVSTGAMHEDGLSDSVDGLWGGHSTERRLEIMKDSRIGAYGVLALIVATGLRWTALAALLPVDAGAVMIAAVLSRAMMPITMYALPHARPDGLSHHVGKPPLSALAIGLVLGSVFALGLSGTAGVGALVVALFAAAFVATIARAKIGGQTGDILGATQIVCEICVLCLLTAVLT